jgi:hypothetical protein
LEEAESARASQFQFLIFDVVLTLGRYSPSIRQFINKVSERIFFNSMFQKGLKITVSYLSTFLTLVNKVIKG